MAPWLAAETDGERSTAIVGLPVEVSARSENGQWRIARVVEHDEPELEP